GQYYRTAKATIYDKPETPVPVYIGASGPAATRLAGRISDGFITTSGKGHELYTDTLLPAVREGAEKGGKTLDDLDLMIEVKVSLDHDLEQARQATHYWGALALTPEEKQSVEDPIEMQRRADALSVDRTGTRWIVSTDPEEHAAKVAEYLDMGFKHLVFHAPGPDQEKFLKLYS